MRLRCHFQRIWPFFFQRRELLFIFCLRPVRTGVLDLLFSCAIGRVFANRSRFINLLGFENLQKISLPLGHPLRAEATIPRMLNYEVRFPGFRLDGKAEEYIRSRMDSPLWQKIVGYAVDYKKMEEKEPEALGHIERRVREITGNVYRFAA